MILFPKQRREEITGLLQWNVTVSDPSAEMDRDKSISVTMLAEVQLPNATTTPHGRPTALSPADKSAA